MTRLPPERRIQAGRTWASSWDPAHYDPIDRPSRAGRWADRACWVASCALAGVVLTAPVWARWIWG